MSDTGIPAHLIDIDRWGGRVMRRGDDGWCLALDRQTMSCLIYHQRPTLCREYPMGGDDCRAERDLYFGPAPRQPLGLD